MNQTVKEKKGLLRAWILRDHGTGVRGMGVWGKRDGRCGVRGRGVWSKRERGMG